MTRARRAAITALLLAMASGCGLTSDVPQSLVQNRCGGDGDCADGTCHPELAVCVASETTPYVYLLDVSPAPEAGGHAQLTARFGPYVASSGASRVELALPRQVPVVGTLRWDGDPIDAQITFVRRADGERIATSRAPSVQAHTFGPPSDGSDPRLREEDWAVELLPSGIYDVIIEPSDADRALLYPRRVAFELGVDGARVPLDYPSSAELEGARFFGRLVDLSGAPQVGLEVRCVDAASGLVISSIATSDEAGDFDVLIDPAASGPWQVRVTAPPERQAEGVFPRFLIDPSGLAPLDGSTPARFGVLVPGSPETVLFKGRVEHTPAGATEPRPVPSASIHLRATDILDEGTRLVGIYDVTVSANERGEYEVSVPRGTYDIDVTPNEPDLGLYAGRTEIRGETLGHALALPARTRIGATVLAPSGLPLPDTRIRALALGIAPAGLTEAGVARLARSSDVTSSSLGQFALPLDVGVYDIRVEPPAGSGFPWLVAPAFPVGSTGAVFAMGNLAVRAPIVVRGGALYGDAGAVAGAEVRAFAIVGPDGAQRAVQVGQATVGMDGTFLLYLPPSI